MIDISNRFEQIRILKKISQKDFANSLGKAPSYISRIEKGQKIPSDSLIKLICYEYGINETWLKTGEGDMLKGPVKPNAINDATSGYGQPQTHDNVTSAHQNIVTKFKNKEIALDMNLKLLDVESLDEREFYYVKGVIDTIHRILNRPKAENG